MTTDIRETRRPPVPVAYKRRMRLADTLQVICVTSVALVNAIFLADGGAAHFGTLADALTSAGILAGLVGTDLLLLMLVLAARLPPIDRAFGHDRAMAVHQQLGKPALYLLLGHAVLLIAGYAAAENVNVFAEMWGMLTTLPDMPLAFVGLGLLILVVVTSLVVVRRRFRYEAWHAVHLLAYLAVLVAIPHQLSVGNLLSEGTIARYYWLALYVGVAGSIVLFRFVLPVVRSVRHGLVVEDVQRVAPGVASIRLSGRHLQELKATSGQFFVWRFWSRGVWWQSHPFSLSAAPTETTLRITVRALGDASSALTTLKRGTRVSFEGPYGIFTDRARTAPGIVLIAAGIGVAPIRSLLETAQFSPGQATVILRSHTVGDSYLAEEVTQLCRERGADLRIIAGTRPPGVDSWLPADAYRAGITIRTIVPWVRAADVYVCGPRPWTDAVVRDARAAGLPARQIHYERFDW
ncbi:ferric reductase-like transmembrane domain-containing protein [Cryobacterium roopkundense]|nr:ferredoxin reductase family protein [Cryobacterium roopkundense]MBB5639625.1 putative ferric reductase [Cryobacterium roopkundense]